MPEEIKNADPSEEYNDDGTKNPDYVAPGTDSKGASAGTEKNGTEGTENTPDADQVDFNDTIDPAKGVEIPTRVSILQNIIARKNNKIEKLKSKTDDGEEDEDPDLDDGTRDTISREIQKNLEPVLNLLGTDAEAKEFDAFLAAEPDAKKYANHIKAYMTHDAYKNVPPAVIYHHLAFSAAQSLGAKRKAAADLEANNLKGAGRTITPPQENNLGNLPSPEDIENMSDEEFDKMHTDALMGKYVNKN